jgi:hypothetical protein
VRLGRALGAAIVLALSGLAAPGVVRAQGQIQLVLPPDDPLPAAPRIVVRATGFPASAGPLQIRLRLALSSGFGLIVYDSTKAGSDVSFTTIQLLPEERDIFAEATVYDQAGRSLSSLLAPIGRTGPRLRLLDPSGTTSVSLNTQQPRFSWRSAAVTTPPGPWVYELFITNVATQATQSRAGITDTVYDYPDTLQANTSYRWKVVARLVNGLPGDSVVVSSLSSFVIAPSNQPVATLLYQNFPNPFPAPSSSTTCFWFDLRTPGEVSLMIYDLRGHAVRTMIPSAQVGATLPAGRYGRKSELESSGCDARFSWDGTANDGRIVPPGVYLVRFRTAGYESMKKMLFRGR